MTNSAPMHQGRMNPISIGAKFLSLTLAGTILAACAGTDFRTEYQKAQDRAANFIAANPTLSTNKQTAIRKAQLLSGMSKHEVIASWGRPAIVQAYRGGAQELWYFGCHWPHICTDSDEDSSFPAPDEIFNSHALFENGKLVEWHG